MKPTGSPSNRNSMWKGNTTLYFEDLLDLLRGRLGGREETLGRLWETVVDVKEALGRGKEGRWGRH